MRSCLRRLLPGAILALTAVLAAVRSDAPTLVDTERAVELHVRALDMRMVGDSESSGEMLEEACLLQHEPSCQAVWLQLDLGSELADPDTRHRLEGTARRLAELTDGTWFMHGGADGALVRVYCPVEREADLRGALRRLRVPLGG